MGLWLYSPKDIPRGLWELYAGETVNNVSIKSFLVILGRTSLCFRDYGWRAVSTWSASSCPPCSFPSCLQASSWASGFTIASGSGTFACSFMGCCCSPVYHWLLDEDQIYVIILIKMTSGMISKRQKDWRIQMVVEALLRLPNVRYHRSSILQSEDFAVYLS